jgi:hypothetical protein
VQALADRLYSRAVSSLVIDNREIRSGGASPMGGLKTSFFLKRGFGSIKIAMPLGTLRERNP